MIVNEAMPPVSGSPPCAATLTASLSIVRASCLLPFRASTVACVVKAAARLDCSSPSLKPLTAELATLLCLVETALAQECPRTRVLKLCAITFVVEFAGHRERAIEMLVSFFKLAKVHKQETEVVFNESEKTLVSRLFQFNARRGVLHQRAVDVIFPAF